MFLKVQGVTGESGDTDHKGEIDVISWSWGMQASTDVATGEAAGRSTMTELEILKRVDQSSPTLMTFLRNNKLVKEARLAVRKAGTTPVEYFSIELENVRVTALHAESHNAELVERLRLGFSRVRVNYTPQDKTGGRGATTVFEADAQAGR
jgi:type VI secretion system secreted protein Hcp